MKILFLDESGDHNLTSPDLQYPVFVLAGRVLFEEYYKCTFDARLTEFKKGILGKQNIVLHYVDYTRNQHGLKGCRISYFVRSFIMG